MEHHTHKDRDRLHDRRVQPVAYQRTQHIIHISDQPRFAARVHGWPAHTPRLNPTRQHPHGRRPRTSNERTTISTASTLSSTTLHDRIHLKYNYPANCTENNVSREYKDTRM